MNCPKCKTSNSDGSKYCIECERQEYINSLGNRRAKESKANAERAVPLAKEDNPVWVTIKVICMIIFIGIWVFRGISKGISKEDIQIITVVIVALVISAVVIGIIIFAYKSGTQKRALISIVIGLVGYMVSGYVYDFFTGKKAPSCDDKRIVNQIISSLNNDQKFKVEVSNDIYSFLCENAIAGRKKADAEVNAMMSSTYMVSNYDSNRLFRIQEEALLYHKQCIAKAEAKTKEHFNKSNTLRLTTIRTTDVNKNTGTNFCVGNIEDNDISVVMKKEYIYKIELTDGGKNYLLSGNWRNR